MPSLIFSHYKLTALQTCQRRFQLRYLERLAWPAALSDRAYELALLRGSRFHQRLHRHFLGLNAAEEASGDPALENWWRAFLAHGPALPPDKHLPELQLSVPMGDHLLVGRFDLLVTGPDHWHIYDWKTESRPRPIETLRQDWQTRLYLALAVEGAPALGRQVAPEQVRMTYWQANAPSEPPTTFVYGQAWHAETWAKLQEMVAAIDRQLGDEGAWPLTEDLEQCRRCPYQAICQRQAPEMDLTSWEQEPDETSLVPDFP